jgi:hypothetical protein
MNAGSSKSGLLAISSNLKEKKSSYFWFSEKKKKKMGTFCPKPNQTKVSLGTTLQVEFISAKLPIWRINVSGGYYDVYC